MTASTETGQRLSGTIAESVSFLFVPGNRPDRFDKAVATGADLIVLDLEDAVPPADKSQARRHVAEWLAGGGRAVVRVNGASDPHHGEDIAALRGAAGLVAVMLAKADLAGVRQVTAQTVPVIALIESASALAEVMDIAATPGVARLAFGHLDYAVDIGATPSHTAMLHARSTLVLASRRSGIAAPVDGVTATLDDDGRLAADIAHAGEVGMGAKLLIHPCQVSKTHHAFAPGSDEILWARTCLARAGDGASRVGGEMVDAPVLARARAIVRRIR